MYRSKLLQGSNFKLKLPFCVNILRSHLAYMYFILHPVISYKSYATIEWNCHLIIVQCYQLIVRGIHAPKVLKARCKLLIKRRFCCEKFALPSFGLLGPSKTCDYDKSHHICPDKCSIDCNKCNCDFGTCEWEDFDDHIAINETFEWKNDTE